MDSIGDMLARIRNGYLAVHKEVKVPYSKAKEKIAEILVREGYLEKVDYDQETRILNLTLKYHGKKPTLSWIKRISRPGQRRYLKAQDIRPVLSGLGFFILSTSSGLMTSREAKKKNLGGEIVCEVY